MLEWAFVVPKLCVCMCVCVGEKIEDTLRNGSKTAMSSEEVKSHQITFALEKETLFLPETEGITIYYIVKKKSSS